MMTIDEEIYHMIDFFAHPCGYEVSLYAILQIRPVDEGCPPSNWEVSWIETKDDLEITSYKEFNNLYEAVRCFVEKRRYLCLGADFEQIMMGDIHPSVEIIE